MKRNLFGIMLLSGISILPKANAQTTYEEMEQLTVNEQITTVITASEPVRFVDISTDKVAGDQPIDNIIRLKPKESGHEDGEILAIVTIVTERYRTQSRSPSLALLSRLTVLVMAMERAPLQKIKKSSTANTARVKNTDWTGNTYTAVADIPIRFKSSSSAA